MDRNSNPCRIVQSIDFNISISGARVEDKESQILLK